mgnify:CR=1 FL=1
MTNLKGLSLFSGGGIGEMFLKDINIDVVVANELLEERCRFYNHLYPNVKMIQGDITDDNIFNSVIQVSKNANVEMIIATPPCQGMSCARKCVPILPAWR